MLVPVYSVGLQAKAARSDAGSQWEGGRVAHSVRTILLLGRLFSALKVQK
jgi:hypothetical protein